MRKTLNTNDRLKSRKAIEQLFENGKSKNAFPVRAVFMQSQEEMHKAGFSVSKRNFKTAVARNRIKRLLREAYRLHRHEHLKDGTKLAMLFIYVGKDMPEYDLIERKMIQLLKKIEA